MFFIVKLLKKQFKVQNGGKTMQSAKCKMQNAK